MEDQSQNVDPIPVHGRKEPLRSVLLHPNPRGADGPAGQTQPVLRGARQMGDILRGQFRIVSQYLGGPRR